MALDCTGVVRSWRFAIFRRTFPSESELMQCITDRGEWVGQVPDDRLDQGADVNINHLHQQHVLTKDGSQVLASTQVPYRSSLFPWFPPTPI